jgi:hypothetical protein
MNVSILLKIILIIFKKDQIKNINQCPALDIKTPTNITIQQKISTTLEVLEFLSLLAR